MTEVESFNNDNNIASKNNIPMRASRHQWGRLGRSVLNGVIGDYLEKQNNPLAIKMAFYNNFKPLLLDETLAHQVDFPLTNKVVVLVHGLTNLETVWDFKQPDSATPAIQMDMADIDNWALGHGGRRNNCGRVIK